MLFSLMDASDESAIILSTPSVSVTEALTFLVSEGKSADACFAGCCRCFHSLPVFDPLVADQVEVNECPPCRSYHSVRMRSEHRPHIVHAVFC